MKAQNIIKNYLTRQTFPYLLLSSIALWSLSRNVEKSSGDGERKLRWNLLVPLNKV